MTRLEAFAARRRGDQVAAGRCRRDRGMRPARTTAPRIVDTAVLILPR